jgi:8-oxo-dGTP diphosphatase
VISAAGGVVWRLDGAGEPEVALVHRTRHDDWSLPKGKARRGEHPLVTALREVAEETGHAVRIGPFLTRVGYHLPDVAGGTHKRVWYWSMRAGAVAGPVDDEVERLIWTSLPAAAERVSYALDREVLDAFARSPRWTATVVVVRPGPEAAVTGFLGPVLTAVDPRRVLAAPTERCVRVLTRAVRTVSPWARPGPQVPQPESRDPERMVTDLFGPAGDPVPAGSAVFCVPGRAVPALVTELVRRGGGSPPAEPELDRGGCWVVHLAGTRVAAVERYQP